MSANKRYGMVVDLKKCVGCHACSAACKAENNVPANTFRTRVKETEQGEFPQVQIDFVKQACMHCQDAPCVRVCPSGASHYSELGTVEVTQDICVGCGYCVEACPYRARMFNHETGLPEKCSLCHHRLKEGQRPACETTCIGNAIVTGDLNDPNSEVSKAFAKGAQPLHEEYKTKPSIFYIPNRRW